MKSSTCSVDCGRVSDGKCVVLSKCGLEGGDKDNTNE